MLRFNAKTDMLVCNLDNRRQDILKVVNVDGCCVHRIGKCSLLAALRLVGMVKYIKKFWMGFEQIPVKH